MTFPGESDVPIIAKRVVQELTPELKWTRLSAVGSAAAALVAIAALVTSFVTVHYSAKQFHSDQRAWVVVESPEAKLMPLDVLDGSPVSRITFNFRNVGKTLATNVRIKVITLRAEFLSDDYIDTFLLGTSMPRATPKVQPLITGIGPPTATDPRRIWPNAVPISLAPGARTIDAYVTAATNVIPGAKPTDPETYSYLFGRADYEDTNGLAHWTTFCYVFINGDDFSYCPSGNAEDSVTEPGILNDYF